MKQYDEIYAEMSDELSRRSGVLVNEGGDMALRLSAVAAEIASLWAQVEWTKNQSFPQTASGKHLDLHAAARGLERALPACATGLIRFETGEQRSKALTIEEGTICLNAAGAEFLTLKQAVIEAGAVFCEVPAAARNAGTAGNAPAESINLMALAPLGVVRCFNPSAFSGGSDGECDESLRKRVLASFANLPNGSNRAYYESVALDTNGVASAYVLPRGRGLGTVDIIISSAAGLPSEEMISSVYKRLYAEREICVDISVLAPTAVTVPVTVAIDVYDSYEFAEVAAGVRAALEAYFDGKLLGRDVLLARLGSVVFGVEGVCNYAFSLPSADIKIAYNQLPVAGKITVVGR